MKSELDLIVLFVQLWVRCCVEELLRKVHYYKQFIFPFFQDVYESFLVEGIKVRRVYGCKWMIVL